MEWWTLEKVRFRTQNNSGHMWGLECITYEGNIPQGQCDLETGPGWSGCYKVCDWWVLLYVKVTDVGLIVRIWKSWCQAVSILETRPPPPWEEAPSSTEGFSYCCPWIPYHSSLVSQTSNLQILWLKVQPVLKCMKSSPLMWKRLVLPARWW